MRISIEGSSFQPANRIFQAGRICIHSLNFASFNDHALPAKHFLNFAMNQSPPVASREHRRRRSTSSLYYFVILSPAIIVALVSAGHGLSISRTRSRRTRRAKRSRACRIWKMAGRNKRRRKQPDAVSVFCHRTNLGLQYSDMPTYRA